MITTKIALLTTWFPPLIVGSGNRFYEIGRRLAGKHEIHVYTTGIAGSAKEEELEGMYVHRYGVFDRSKSIERGSTLHNLKFSLHLLRRLRYKSFWGTTGFEIIDCNIVSKLLPYASFFISKSMHAPLIETWHEVWYKENFRQYNLVLTLPGFLLERFMPALSDFNIAVSQTTKMRLANLLRVPTEKITVVPNGVDLEKFNAISVEKKRYGRILYAGRLESHKRVDTLILAYKQLKMRYKDIELIIVGTGLQEQYLKGLAKGLEDVTFYAPMPYESLIELAKSSWIFVLPSIREGQGIVLLEAMAAGTPPIAVQAEGSAVGDVITDNHNGLLVSPGEIEGAIKRLLTDDDLHTQIRENGLEFVKGYDWANIAKRTEEVYEEVGGTQ